MAIVVGGGLGHGAKEADIDDCAGYKGCGKGTVSAPAMSKLNTPAGPQLNIGVHSQAKEPTVTVVFAILSS